MALVATPAYYVNSEPHIGHLYSNVLGAYLASSLGQILVSGTDLHGRKMRLSAEAAAMVPGQYVRRASEPFRALLARASGPCQVEWCTTEHLDHAATALNAWEGLARGGHLTFGLYKGYYSVPDEAFSATPREGYSPVSEPNLFLRLEGLAPKVRALYEEGRIEVYPSFYRAKIEEFLKEVGDLCVTRREE